MNWTFGQELVVSHTTHSMFDVFSMHPQCWSCGGLNKGHSTSVHWKPNSFLTSLWHTKTRFSFSHELLGNRYRTLYFQTGSMKTWRMHWKFPKHGKCCVQNYQLPSNWKDKLYWWDFEYYYQYCKFWGPQREYKNLVTCLEIVEMHSQSLTWLMKSHKYYGQIRWELIWSWCVWQARDSGRTCYD